jgi:hypothetical protein
MNTVIFACVHSAGRSQMAAASFNLLADPTKVRAVSARTAPAAQVHPEVIAAMAEVGLDLRNAGGYFRIAPYRATQLSLHTLIPPFVPDAQRRAIEAKRPDPCDRVAASSRRPTHPGAVRLGRPTAGFGNTTTSGDHLAIAVVPGVAPVKLNHGAGSRGPPAISRMRASTRRAPGSWRAGPARSLRRNELPS